MWFLCENEDEQEIIESDEYPKMIGEGGRWTHVTRGYKTKEELWIDRKILEKPCVICGQWASTHYHGNERMIAKNMCFGCNLWDLRSENITNNIMIVDHQWYTIAQEFSGPGFRGFGGREFIFKVISTGEIETGKNVWFGGRIPKYFYDKIPDNAIIVNGYEPPIR